MYRIAVEAGRDLEDEDIVAIEIAALDVAGARRVDKSEMPNRRHPGLPEMKASECILDRGENFVPIKGRQDFGKIENSQTTAFLVDCVA